MAYKCVIDLVEVERVKRSIEGEHGERFLKRVFTFEEIEYCTHGERYNFQSFAVRFAAKEAFAKAMWTGIGSNVVLNEISVINVAEGICKGKPELKLSGATKEFFDACGGRNIEISLTHTESMAQAMCIIEFN